MSSTSNADHRTANAAAPAAADLRQAIEHAAHFLPAQGPIQVFIHHNTLHVFDELPFSEAVVRGERIFGCEPYLSEERFARERARGRIRDEDVVAVVEADLGAQGGEKVLGESRRDFRLALLRHAVYDAPAAELRWHMAESHSLRRFRPDVIDERRDRFVAETRHWALRDLLPEPSPEAEAADETGARAAVREILRKAGPAELENRTDTGWEAFGLEALWRACSIGVRCAALAEPPPAPIRHRDWLLAAAEVDADRLAHELLIPFCGVFLDQGLAPWALPGRERGFYQAFFDLHAGGAAGAAWHEALPAEIRRLRAANLSPIESVAESLQLLGVAETERDDFLAGTLLALRGFAGMLWQVETRGDRVHHPLPADCLVEFLAVRLVLDRLALAFLAKDRLGLDQPLDRLRSELETRVRRPDDGRARLAFHIFTSAQALGWLPNDLVALTASQWRGLIGEFLAFPAIERRRLLHLAYERRHRITTLDAIAAHRPAPAAATRPRFQAACCIDEREESFRRHLEEIAPDAVTFGVAGFFGIAIYYRGLADAAFSPLCPAVMQPTHWVTEEVDSGIEAAHRRRVGLRRVLGDLA
ncbi:MAG TPA: putative inorganic carbon transporter subunit DabA, partial [Planctomycetia bacterium]|nr:putative inorganic carbon transporter subunit DabA [Planctomycetia bacterium]